jgi:putative addiction module CopG family antidote
MAPNTPHSNTLNSQLQIPDQLRIHHPRDLMTHGGCPILWLASAPTLSGRVDLGVPPSFQNNLQLRTEYLKLRPADGRKAGIMEAVESRTMNINLTPEQEKIVQDKLKTGQFRTAQEVIGEALQVLREKERSSTVGSPNGAQREAVREMLAFVEKNCVRLEGVSVKELIHEGHRL